MEGLQLTSFNFSSGANNLFFRGLNINSPTQTPTESQTATEQQPLGTSDESLLDPDFLSSLNIGFDDITNYSDLISNSILNQEPESQDILSSVLSKLNEVLESFLDKIRESETQEKIEKEFNVFG